jgi:hypothetical protein
LLVARRRLPPCDQQFHDLLVRDDLDAVVKMLRYLPSKKTNVYRMCSRAKSTTCFCCGTASTSIGASDFALINAAVITKVIMIGEYAKLGKRYEYKSILISAVWKAFVFALLVFVFHVVEEVIKRLIHGADFSKSFTNIRFDRFAGRAIVVFCVFIPLFAWREFRRVMGKEEFRYLFYGSAAERQ